MWTEGSKAKNRFVVRMDTPAKVEDPTMSAGSACLLKQRVSELWCRGDSLAGCKSSISKSRTLDATRPERRLEERQDLSGGNFGLWYSIGGRQRHGLFVRVVVHTGSPKKAPKEE